MGRKLPLAFFSAVAAVCALFAVAACESESAHVHTFSTKWSYDADYHWHRAICDDTDEVTGKEKHDFVNDVCSTCGYKRQKFDYELNQDMTCTVTGVGTVTGVNIVIPDEIDGYKVTAIGSYAFTSNRNIKSVTIDGAATIGDGAFYGCTALENIELSESLTTIGDDAFFGCTALEEIVVPDSVETMGASVFHGCVALKNIKLSENLTAIDDDAFFGCTSLEEMVVPDSVEAIGDLAFDGCTALKNIKLSENLTTIDVGAFWDCTSLEEIVIPDSVETIGDSAFGSCTALEKIKLSKNLTSLSSSVFWYCTSLKEIVVPDGVETIGNSAFYGCTALENVELPDSLTVIDICAFRDCTSLMKLTIPVGVTEIGGNAFSYCYRLIEITNLSSLDIEKGSLTHGGVAYYALSVLNSVSSGNFLYTDNGYTLYINEDGAYLTGYDGDETDLTLPETNGMRYTINDYAFYGNERIESVTIGNSVTGISPLAFGNCIRLYALTIGENVNLIDRTAFDGCYRIIEIYNQSSLDLEAGGISGGMATYQALNIYTRSEGASNITKTDDGFIFYADGDVVYLVGYDGDEADLTLPTDFNGSGYAVYDYAFYATPIESIVIPDGVISLGRYAFSYCASLKSVILGDGLNVIDSHAFYLCTSLENIIIPDSVTAINQNVFNGCSALESVTIGAGVTYIGAKAFNGCYALKRAVFGQTAGWTAMRTNSSGQEEYRYVIIEKALNDVTTAARVLSDDTYSVCIWSREDE